MQENKSGCFFSEHSVKIWRHVESLADMLRTVSETGDMTPIAGVDEA